MAWTRAPWGYLIENDKYVLDTEPVICLLKDRPQNYLALYNEPNTSPKLLGISKSQIARESVDVFLEVRRTRQVLTHLYLKYGVQRKNKKGYANSDNSQKNLQKINKETNLVLSKQLLFWTAGQNFKDWITPRLKQAKYDLIKEIEEQSLQVGQKKFVQVTAQQIISRPEAKKKSFWYTLNLKEREIIYDKLVSKVSILNGEVVSVDLTV